ncbi:MAG: restriction endonuclease [Chloroflexi bacterium]|nr:restriction endonuclease [Chloroflexota bacterium]
MARKASDIPVGTQFSPDLVALRPFLNVLTQHSGDRDQMLEAIWSPSVRIAPIGRDLTPRRKSLPIEAAVQYGLLEPKTHEATDLTVELLDTETDDELHDAFARHILLSLGGLRVVETAQQMELDGRRITSDSLAECLTDQGFRVTIHNTAINSIRMWLAKAGVFPPGRHNAWKVNPLAKRRLLGMADSTIAQIAWLEEDQKAYLEALCRIDPSDWYPAASVRDLGDRILGRRLDRSNLPKSYLQPLQEAGLIEYRTGGTASGKSSHLRTTSLFKRSILHKFVQETTRSLDPSLTAYYLRRPEDIYSELESPDKHVKGEALEAFAIRIMRLLGLRFVAWRKRAAAETGRAEVDVLMAGTVGGVPTRWQIQCKNKPGGLVTLEDIAKEVGIALITKANQVLILANSRVTQDAREFAREVMKHTALTVMILDKDDYNTIREFPGSIGAILQEKAQVVQRVSRYGVDWIRNLH